MVQVKISKTYTFDAAHQLRNHKGKCARLHGHTYTVTVWIKGDQQNLVTDASDYGMLVDYTDLDLIVKPLVDRLDHKFIAKGDEPVLYDGLRDTDVEVIRVRTTAENLAIWFWDHIRDEMVLSRMRQFKRVELMGVIVQETPKTSAEFISEVNL